MAADPPGAPAVTPHDHPTRPALATWMIVGALAIVAFFLVTEHTAHVLGALPYLLLLACPVMHLLMHRGHRHGGGAGDT